MPPTPPTLDEALDLARSSNPALHQAQAGVEAASAGATRGTHGELMASTDIKHSDCQKCGAYSVNPAQARLNKIAGRKVRKELIRESNRISA